MRNRFYNKLYILIALAAIVTIVLANTTPIKENRRIGVFGIEKSSPNKIEILEENKDEIEETNVIEEKIETQPKQTFAVPKKQPVLTNSNETQSPKRKVTVTKNWDDSTLPIARPLDLKVYLKAKIAKFTTGSSLNNIMKNLAGGSSTATGTTIDNNIYAIKKADALDTTKTYRDVSASNSDEPIYMWYDSNTIYWYSDAKVVYLNEDSSTTFKNLKKLTDISGLSDINTSFVTNTKEMFTDDENLNDLSPLSSWNISNVTNMGSMFRNCVSITDLSPLSNWNTSNVMDMSFTFGAQNAYIDKDSYTTKGMGYTSLKPLTNWDVSKVTNLEQTFKGAIKITSLEGLENWNTSNVRSVQQMLEAAFGLEDVSALKNWDASNMTSTNVQFATTKPGNATAYYGDTWFTNRTGYFSFNSNDDTVNLYFTSTAAGSPNPVASPVIPTGTSYETEASKWVKNGNVWTYIFEVEDDLEYYGFEEQVPYYISDTLITSPKDVINNQITINNTLDAANIKTVDITKVWSDTDSSLRPDELTFTIRKEGKIDPNYQLVEYLYTNGGGWIDTGIKGNGDYTLYGDGSIISGRGSSFIDAFASTSDRTGNLIYNTSSYRFAYYWKNVGNTYVNLSRDNIDLSSRFQTTQSKNGITFTQGNYTQTFSYSGSSGTVGANIYLMRQQQTSNSNATLYNAKIYTDNGTTLLYDFKPCYRISDNQPGVYDVVNNTFYPTTGGTVTVGPDVPAVDYEVTQTVPGGKWTKNGDTWTTTMLYDNVSGILKISETDPVYYTSDSPYSNAKTIVNDAVTITNTQTSKPIKIIKSWNDLADDTYRPSNIDVYLTDNSSITYSTTADKWVKKGDVWEYSFEVPLDSTQWYAYESSVANYISSATYSNKVAVTNNQATITNTLGITNLIISKKVSGNLADINDTFTFTIKLTDGGMNINGTYNVTGYSSPTITFDSNGEATLTMGHGDSIKLINLPVGSTYTISETYGDYTPKITIIDATGTINNLSTNPAIAQGVLNYVTNVQFNNHNGDEDVPVTGLFNENKPFIIMLLISIPLGIIYFIIKEKYSD